MSEEVLLNHVALQYSDREKAAIFFTKILGIPRVKNFTLSKELSAGIFGINNGVDIDVYDNGRARFEVFISHTTRNLSYEHICIEVKDKKEFILRCKKYGLEPFTIKKDGKDLLFVRDFSDYLYEVKEQ
ncbi:MAG: VOC family protein [Thermoplasmatales archaeon]|nr:MAG: VOC family protein [Thermoplasmatales archaeon]